jgi:hypothetical protein
MSGALNQGSDKCCAQKQIREQPDPAVEPVKKHSIKYHGGDVCRQVSDDDVVPGEPEELADHRSNLGSDAKEDRQGPRQKEEDVLQLCSQAKGRGR